VFGCVAHSAPDFQYDPTRASFRGWPFAVTRNDLRKLGARKARQAGGSGDTEVHQLLEQQPDPATDEERWRQGYQWNLFQWASEKVRVEFREPTWQASWQTAALGEDIDQVAGDLCVSPGAVYIALSRVTARIRRGDSGHRRVVRYARREYPDGLQLQWLITGPHAPDRQQFLARHLDSCERC
jgi:RNA polymerase sigma-70 factor (ECF subfamily)